MNYLNLSGRRWKVNTRNSTKHSNFHSRNMTYWRRRFMISIEPGSLITSIKKTSIQLLSLRPFWKDSLMVWAISVIKKQYSTNKSNLNKTPGGKTVNLKKRSINWISCCNRRKGIAQEILLNCFTIRLNLNGRKAWKDKQSCWPWLLNINVLKRNSS